MFVFPPYGPFYRQASCRRYGGRAGLQKISEHGWDGWITHPASEQSMLLRFTGFACNIAQDRDDKVYLEICLERICALFNLS